MHVYLKRRVFIGVAFCAVTVISSWGADDARFFFAEEPVHPRKAAMGCAGAALDGGGFCFYNPATIGLGDVPFIGVEFGQQGGGLSKSLIETGWMSRTYFAGASLLVHSTDWQTATEQGIGGMCSNQAFGTTIVGGYRRGAFSTGQSIMVLSERIGDFAMHAVTFNTGVTYRIIPGSLTVGASAYHFLRFDTLRTPWTRTPRGWYRSALGLPRMVRAGVAWNDTLRDDMPVTVAADLLYRYAGERIMLPIGVEAWILPWIAGRLGKRFNHPGDILHVGCGIRWSSLEMNFDYAIDRPPVSGAEIEPKWLFGLTYTLKKPVPLQRERQATSTPAPREPADTSVRSPHVPVPPTRPSAGQADTTDAPDQTLGNKEATQGTAQSPQSDLQDATAPSMPKESAPLEDMRPEGPTGSTPDAPRQE